MPIDFPSSPTTNQQYVYNGVTYTYTAQGMWVAAGGGVTDSTPPQGRLTLQTATPVMTTAQAGKTTLFYSSYCGSLVPIYTGTEFVMTALPGGEISAATTDATKSPAAVGASQVLDWYVWLDGATVRLGHGPAWTNDTTRSAGTALVMVGGRLLNNAAITNGPAAQRGTYVGTTYSNASSQLDWIYGAVSAGGTAGALHVWNAYNRVNVATLTGDTADSWTTSSAAFASNSTGTRVHFVSGLAEDSFSAVYLAHISGASNTGNAIGYDVVNAHSGTTGFVSGGASQSVSARYDATALGKHYVAALERSASGSGTMYGDNALTVMQTGMWFQFRM